MAKAGGSNLIEQHAEKGLLVLALAGLVFVVFKYVTSSPREFKPPSVISAQPLPPEKIDPTLQRRARKVKKTMGDAEPENAPIVDLTSEISRRQRLAFGGADDPYLGIWKRDFISLAPPVQMPEVIPPVDPGRPPNVKDMAIDIAPTAPLVCLKRELPARPDPSDMAAHGVASFDWGKLKAKWNAVVAATTIRPSLLVLSVRVDVRERPIGGDWGPAKPAPVTAMPLPVTVRGEERLFRLPDDIPKIPLYERNFSNEEEVLATIAFLEKLQPYVLQPPWYPIWWAGSQEWVDWKIHLPETQVSKKYVEGLGPGVREPGRPGRVPLVPTRRPTRRRPVRPTIEDYEGGPGPPVRRTPSRAPSRAPKRTVPRRPARPPRVPMEEGEMPGIRPRPRPGAKPKRPPLKKPEEEIEYVPPPDATPVPPLQQQIQEGTVLVWFHQDTGLELRKEYQFRVRLELKSPLYMEEEVVDDVEKDARVISLLTPPSEWSAPVSVPQATRFFVTGAMAQDRSLRATVFAFCYGERVMKTFKVYEGQPIGGKAKMKVPNPALRQQAVKRPGARGTPDEDEELPETVTKEVDFSTGAVAVEFDFNKAYDRPGLGPGRTVEMLYMDYRARLLRRILAEDRGKKEYRRLLEEVKRAKASATPKKRTR